MVRGRCPGADRPQAVGAPGVGGGWWVGLSADENDVLRSVLAALGIDAGAAPGTDSGGVGFVWSTARYR